MLTACVLRLFTPRCSQAASVCCTVSARSRSVCALEAPSCRSTRTPVTDCFRFTQSRVPSSTFTPRFFTHTGCTFGTVFLSGRRPKTWINDWPTPVARVLCYSKRQEFTKGPNEDRSEDSPVSGQGLFKFKQLYENPWTIPNLLCVCRILLAPVLGHLIMTQHFHLSLALFTLAGATDVLDGYIARTWPSQKSALGSALDPLADKILISVLYVSLTYAELIPVLLTALVIARDIGLIAAVFWVRYKTVPPPVTLSKFFNPCYTTAQLKPTLFSKMNTAIQLFLVAASLAAPVLQYTDSAVLQCLWFVTAVTTTASGYSYWHYGRKTVKLLNTRPP
ncbi:cardiolipin synthase (CMP-forming) [Eucyclogobius newberryi]|uniref:cardiolipin synthase (CMP-forming) n=1 Tax=Eucyclogobius newberryi TaxID=166745 RepID=UPI003B5A8A28